MRNSFGDGGGCSLSRLKAKLLAAEDVLVEPSRFAAVSQTKRRHGGRDSGDRGMCPRPYKGRTTRNHPFGFRSRKLVIQAKNPGGGCLGAGVADPEQELVIVALCPGYVGNEHHIASCCRNNALHNVRAEPDPCAHVAIRYVFGHHRAEVQTNGSSGQGTTEFLSGWLSRFHHERRVRHAMEVGLNVSPM